MLNIPVLRWGKPYESLEIDEVMHFITGEPIAKVSQANGGIVGSATCATRSRPATSCARFRSRS